MAVGKKSFIAYADWISQIEMLTDEEAGKLFRHLLKYVNDENPTFEKEDRLLAIAFEPIKNQLKRDLNSWEDRKESKKEGAKIGNLKRYHPKIYDKLHKGEITLEEAENLAYSRIPSHSEKTARIATDSEDNSRIASKNLACLAVNDNVNVNVNEYVNDNVNVIEVVGEYNASEKNQNPPPPDLLDDRLYNIDDLESECKKDRFLNWVNLNCKQNEIDAKVFFEQLTVFSEFLKSEGTTTKTLKDYRSHFSRWVKKRITVIQNSNKPDLSLDLTNPDKQPDNSGDWIFLNKAWRRISNMTPIQRKKLGLK